MYLFCDRLNDVQASWFMLKVDFVTIHVGVQPEILQGRGVFVESRHFDKYFVKKTQEKKTPQGKFWEFLLLDTLKTTS